MALNTFNCNYLTPLHFKGLKSQLLWSSLFCFFLIVLCFIWVLHLLSSTLNLLKVLCTCQVATSLAARSFTVAGPRLGINLPLHLRDSELTLLEFRRLLETHLFSRGSPHIVAVVFTACYKWAYLLTCSLYRGLKSAPEGGAKKAGGGEEIQLASDACHWYTSTYKPHRKV